MQHVPEVRLKTRLTLSAIIDKNVNKFPPKSVLPSDMFIYFQYLGTYAGVNIPLCAISRVNIDKTTEKIL